MAKRKRKTTRRKIEKKKLYSVKVLNEDGTYNIVEIFKSNDFFKKSFNINNSTFISSFYNLKDFEKEANNYYNEIEELLK